MSFQSRTPLAPGSSERSHPETPLYLFVERGPAKSTHSNVVTERWVGSCRRDRLVTRDEEPQRDPAWMRDGPADSKRPAPPPSMSAPDRPASADRLGRASESSRATPAQHRRRQTLLSPHQAG